MEGGVRFDSEYLQQAGEWEELVLPDTGQREDHRWAYGRWRRGFFSLVIASTHFLGDNHLSGSDVVSGDNNLASLVVVTEVCSKSSFALRMHW